jgi:hypothetical protein
MVDCLAYATDFGLRVGILRWNPYGKGDLATIQPQLGHLLGGGRHPIQRPESADDQ